MRFFIFEDQPHPRCIRISNVFILHNLTSLGLGGERVSNLKKITGSEVCVYPDRGAQKHFEVTDFRQNFSCECFLTEGGLQCCRVFCSSGHESSFLLRARCSLMRRKKKKASLTAKNIQEYNF